MTDPAKIKVSNEEALQFLNDYSQTLDRRVRETGCADGAAQEALQRFIARRMPKNKGPVGIWETGFNACLDQILSGPR